MTWTFDLGVQNINVCYCKPLRPRAKNISGLVCVGVGGPAQVNCGNENSWVSVNNCAVIKHRFRPLLTSWVLEDFWILPMPWTARGAVMQAQIASWDPGGHWNSFLTKESHLPTTLPEDPPLETGLQHFINRIPRLKCAYFRERYQPLSASNICLDQTGPEGQIWEVKKAGPMVMVSRIGRGLWDGNTRMEGLLCHCCLQGSWQQLSEPASSAIMGRCPCHQLVWPWIGSVACVNQHSWKVILHHRRLPNGGPWTTREN